MAGKTLYNQCLALGEEPPEFKGRKHMSIGLIFWVIMLLWILGYIGSVYSPGTYPWPHASNLMLLILLFLLGWHAFGFIVHA